MHSKAIDIRNCDKNCCYDKKLISYLIHSIIATTHHILDWLTTHKPLKQFLIYSELMVQTYTRIARSNSFDERKDEKYFAIVLLKSLLKPLYLKIWDKSLKWRQIFWWNIIKTYDNSWGLLVGESREYITWANESCLK